MYPGGPHQQPGQYPHTHAMQQQQPSPPSGGGATPWLIAVVAGLLATVFLVLWLISGGDSAPTAAPATVTETETETSAVTTTTTTTTTVTTQAEPAPRTTATTQAPPATTQQQQWPSPPYPAGNGFEWVRQGPYSSTWTCGQAADQWPAGKGECFNGPDGNAYFYGLRQASR